MGKSIDLTQGNITKELMRLALPILLTSFIQVAYGFMDTFFIGQLSDEAVAAVGTAGYFLWLGTSIALICKIGGNVTISQSLGSKDYDQAKKYIGNSLKLNVIIAVIYSIILVTFSRPIIGFFDLGNASINNMAVTYITVIGLSMIFYFFNPVMSSIFIAFGNSRVPFVMNVMGFVINIVLDPLLIFGGLGLPELGVWGAALATAIAQVAVSAGFIIYIVISLRKGEYQLLKGVHKVPLESKIIKDITKIGLPAAIQSGALACMSMVVAKVIAIWGPFAIAAQKVGTQIESISWATCEGVSVAVSTFVGHNYGAGKYERMKKGVKVSTIMVTVIGAVATMVLLLFNKQIYEIFVSNPETIKIGIEYMTILAFSQILMCIEISTTGAFNGISKSGIAALIIVIVTFARIPLSYGIAYLGLDISGIWWIISGTSMVKGIILMAIFVLYMKYRVKDKMLGSKKLAV